MTEPTAEMELEIAVGKAAAKCSVLSGSEDNEDEFIEIMEHAIQPVFHKHEAVPQNIKDFLKERRESDGGGWAPVTEEDMDLLHAVIYSLIEAKWGADADGDRPMQYQLIDRTKYWPSHYFPIPYGHKTGKREEEFDNAMTNLSMAMEAVRTTEVMVERYMDRDAKIPVKEADDG